MNDVADEVALQRQYYTATANNYDDMHGNECDEHAVARTLMLALLDHLQVKSVLDVGAGTGRELLYLKQQRPHLHITGIEPVAALRAAGHAKGLTAQELQEGDAYALGFSDGQFDLVCEFGVLHHVRKPERVVAEMLRVANKAIFISDANNFGQGSGFSRAVKQLLNMLGLWRVADFVKTGGKGYAITQGDGLAYSYSVFNNYKQIQQQCKTVHLLNTKDGAINPYRTASHIALMGVKK